MSIHSTGTDRPTGSVAESGAGRTPARRRRIVAALNVATNAALAAGMLRLCAKDGWNPLDVAMLACFLVALPWVVLAFWNAVIGLWLLHGRRAALPLAAPWAASGETDAPIQVRTAVVMTLRNEDPARAFARLRAVKRSLDGTGFGAMFAYFVLSDSDVAAVTGAEETAFAAWQAREGADAERLVYRRRHENIGFKGGNVRDFCETHGAAFEFMVPLDADSFMAGDTIVRMVRIGQAHRTLGILQSLAVGLPSRSAFARVFQFGMRHGMRPYTMGSTWWSADSGQFWGHNALVRIAPFLAHCELPVLPGKPPLGGPILSHDQVEGALMRAAGYDVRLLPFELGSYEENPPTILEFMRRDLRWCQGNMQYWRLLRRPGLTPTSRFQLLWAVLMYLCPPAVTLIMMLVAARAIQGFGPAYPAGQAAALYLAFLLLHIAPKLAGFLDVALRPGGLRGYGGGPNFAAGCGVELVFSFLLGAATALQTSVFMVGLCLGRRVAWNGQIRDAHAVSWRTALRTLWPQTLFGAALLGVVVACAPALIGWSLPLTAGLVLAVPFAVGTADPAVGAWLAETGLCGVPEEFDPPPELRLLDTPAPGQAGSALPAAAVGAELS
jgi:membrane glycosyltransferase